MMLIRLAQTLNLVNELSVLLALDTDDNGHPAKRQEGGMIMVFGDGLQIGHVDVRCWLLEDVGEVLGHETV